MKTGEKKGLVSGTPSAWEAKGMWVHDPAGTLQTGNEFERCVEHLDRSLERWLKSTGHQEGDCYYRWDFFGDRTQYLEVVKREVLDERLLSYVQELLKKWDCWRVVIPTPGVPGEAIMIYSNVVRIWREGSAPLSELLCDIRLNLSL